MKTMFLIAAVVAANCFILFPASGAEILGAAGKDDHYLPPWENSPVPTAEKTAGPDSPAAQYMMGEAFVEAGFSEGWALMEKAANSGHVQAMVAMGRYYTDGFYPINPVKGVGYLQKASDRGDAGAATLLGRAYLFGTGVVRSTADARRYFNRAYHAGDSDAAYYLAAMKYYGLGTPENKAEGLAGIMEAARAGSREARRQMQRFATEDALGYLKTAALTRPLAKTYLLSQGGVFIGAEAECDHYDVSGFFDPDYGIDKVTVCFAGGGAPLLVFSVREAMDPAYKEYLLRYGEDVPVKWEILGK